LLSQVNFFTDLFVLLTIANALWSFFGINNPFFTETIISIFFLDCQLHFYYNKSIDNQFVGMKSSRRLTKKGEETRNRIISDSMMIENAFEDVV
jgi:hypothetical protein